MDTLRFLSHTDATQHDGISVIIRRSSEVIFIQPDFHLDRIAREVADDSTAAFNEAFKRIFNQNPGEYRRQSEQLTSR